MVLVLKQGMILAGLGVAMGLVASMLVNKALAEVLFGIPAVDFLNASRQRLHPLGRRAGGQRGPCLASIAGEPDGGPSLRVRDVWSFHDIVAFEGGARSG